MKNVKTMNLPTAAGLFMRPITVYGGCSEDAIIKEQQEQKVLEVLDKSGVSLYSYDLRISSAMTDFPLTHYQTCNYRSRTRAVTSTLMRLERKGKVISTLYRGSRYYSIPLSNDEIMRDFIMEGGGK